jgi:hypothetical protein
MGAEVTFADYEKTRRKDLIQMVEKSGIRAGDVVVVRAVGDFGIGAESARIQKQIVDLGATIEVLPGDEQKRVTGRPAKLEFKSLEDWEDGCEIWYSPYPDSEAYKRIGRLVGGEVDKNWVNYRCGPRSAKNRDAKRATMVTRLKRNQE